MMRALLLACALLAAGARAAPTLRVDYQHSGNAQSEHYALERVVIEPLPWPGAPEGNIDLTGRGQNLLEVLDAKGVILYQRGFSTVFGEWRSTAEAQGVSRAFQESVRFPDFGEPVLVRILKRDQNNHWKLAWSAGIDPKAFDTIRKHAPAPAPVLPIRVSGPSAAKVDLLIMGDGYRAADMGKFEADARRLSDHLLATPPFRERAADFNIWAMAVPTLEAGIARPSAGVQRASALGTRYDIFGSERYILTLDNRALRETAQYAPYEFIEILVNNDTYGGGGIFGQFSTAAAGNEWADYLFVHEFAHHFAGLADEYYTSEPVYLPSATRTEPWEPNVTADPRASKWQRHVKPGTPLPTPWPKEKYETVSRAYQVQRAALRAARRPEAEMNALMRQVQARTEALFAKAPQRRQVGAFEGANYEARGYYRPAMQCIMFDRSETFCKVCHDAIGAIIDLYAPPPAAK